MSKSTHPIQPVVLDDKGTARFKPNAIVEFLLDAGPFDMNTIALGDFTDEDREQFAQLIGYSVCGFGELGYASDSVYEAAADDVKRLMRNAKRRAKRAAREVPTTKGAYR